jgi:hypothetical protein
MPLRQREKIQELLRAGGVEVLSTGVVQRRVSARSTASFTETLCDRLDYPEYSKLTREHADSCHCAI